MVQKTKQTNAEINALVAKATPVKITPRKVNWPEQTANRRPKKHSMINARMAIQALELECKLDVFHGRYVVEGSPLGGYVGELSDKVTRKLREMSFAYLGLDPGKDATYDGVLRACEHHAFDPVQDYLDSLVWDGTPRLEKWLTAYLGVEDTPLHRAWGRIVLVAAVRRIRDHGCKFDHVLVLEGPEGRDKSNTVQVLASGKAGGRDNFSDSTILNKDEKQQMELTKGVWFYEIAELAGMRKADVYSVKAFITRQEDRARPAYERFKELQPRVCIFIGTFNTTADSEVIEYLTTGDNRRWWPVLVGFIDIAALERDRDQLFAEAVFEDTVLGTPIKLDPSLWEAATEVQKSRELSDPLADRLARLYANVTADDVAARLTLPDNRSVERGIDYILTDADVWVSAKLVIDLLPATLTSDGRRIAAAMHKLGWRRTNDNRAGRGVRGYVHARVSDGPAL